MRLIPLPSEGGSGTGEVDVGSAPSQIPNNTIVQSTVNTIITSMIGSDPEDIPTNQQVNQSISNVTQNITSIEEQLIGVTENNTQLTQQITNIINNPEIVRPFIEAISSESLMEGMYIKIFRDGDVTKCCRANAATGILANGFVLANYDVGANTKCYIGENEKGNDLPAGKLYLSAVTPGRASSTPPVEKSGHWLQEIGESIGLNKHMFKVGLTIHLM